MTQLNELIALNGMQAFHAGEKSGTDRAINILEGLKTEFGGNDYSLRTIAKAIQLLKESNHAV
jgi:hypothetical protein